MAEWEETLIDPTKMADQIDLLNSKIDSMTNEEITEELVNTIIGITKQQAKASFEAGARSRDAEVKQLKEAIKAIRLRNEDFLQRGRQEVVDWLESHQAIMWISAFESKKWKEQKEKWGVK